MIKRTLYFGSQGLLSAPVENNTALVTCNNKHHPIAVLNIIKPVRLKFGG